MRVARSYWVRFTRWLIRARLLKPNDKNLLVILLRCFAAPIVLASEKLKIHPTSVTAVSILMALSSALCFAIGELYGFFFLWTISIFLDYADGALARRTGQETRFGYMLDMIGDRIKLVGLIIVWSTTFPGNDIQTLALLQIGLIAAAAVLSHAYVPRWELQPLVKNSFVRQASYCLLQFDMHSFFILGILIFVTAPPYDIAFLWLLIVLALHLAQVTITRISRSAPNLILNPRWRSFLKLHKN